MYNSITSVLISDSDALGYRKNPQHFLEFRHTKKPSDTKSEESKSERTTSTNIESKSERRASSTNVESKSEKRATSRNTKTKSSRKEKREEGDERERMEVEGYRNLLKFGIVNNSISEAHKLYGLLSTKEPLTHSRLLAEFRTEHKITPSEHKRALSALHWTTTDYERGYHVPVLL
jgi:hypothetical protein